MMNQKDKHISDLAEDNQGAQAEIWYGIRLEIVRLLQNYSCNNPSITDFPDQQATDTIPGKTEILHNILQLQKYYINDDSVNRQAYI